ncbi:MAG: hypothetical protein ACRD04_03900 [Terriglobales bacterium]
MHQRERQIPIWFFIGLLLAVYGALILGAGLWQLGHPARPAVVLASLHIGIWWGALLLAAGVFYAVRFRPGRR